MVRKFGIAVAALLFAGPVSGLLAYGAVRAYRNGMFIQASVLGLALFAFQAFAISAVWWSIPTLLHTSAISH